MVIKLQSINKSFGDLLVLNDITLEIAKGEMVAIYWTFG